MPSAIHPSRQAFVEDAEQDEEGIDLANVPLDSNYQILPGATGESSQTAAGLLNDFARRRKAAALAVPTDDQRVRTELRTRGEPITLFGERREDRRDRLRELMLRELEGDGEGDVDMQDESSDSESEGEGEEFYTEGNPALLDARRKIANFSLPRAKQRAHFQRTESGISVATHVRHRNAIKEKLSTFELYGSQAAGDRPVGMVRFSPDGKTLACGDWAGKVKIIDVNDLEPKKVLRGHKGMIGGLSWYPGATIASIGVAPEAINLASSGGDNDIHLWSLTQETPVASLTGHTGRVCRTEFHPSGRYLASASYDTSWRLWDVDTTTELLLQEGHSKEVYAIAFNGDGSLMCSAGLDSIGRIWDLRTGRTVMLLEGHVAPIYALDWSPDSVRVLSGSSDGFAKCWDMRSVKEVASIGAHVGGVSDLRWFKGTDGPLSGQNLEKEIVMVNGDSEPPGKEQFRPKTSGTFVVSCGFDKTVNIFSADDWALCKSMSGHDGTVLSTDISSDARRIASCGRDRTIKLWAMEDPDGL